MGEDRIRKITDISPRRLEDTKRNSGLQKVVKKEEGMGKGGERERERGNMLYDEKLHNV
jgi:hypothetical protein